MLRLKLQEVVMQAEVLLLLIYPLNKRSFIRTVITRISIEIQCTFLLRTGKQHHLVAMVLFSYFLIRGRMTL